MYTIKSANINVMVSNMDRSVDFYTNGLGLELKQRWDDHYALVETPGLTIGLHPWKEISAQQGNISIGLNVDDLAAAKERLESLGVKYQTAEDTAGDFLNFADPDGTPIYFMKLKW